MFESTLGVWLFLACTLVAVTALCYLRFINRLADTSVHMTYSDPVQEALSVKGIYWEHGMVDADDGRSVTPQNKRSAAYYNLLG